MASGYRDPRYEAYYPHTVAGDLVDGVIEIMTFGAAKAQIECVLTDTETGETRTGFGETEDEAYEDARNQFDE